MATLGLLTINSKCMFLHGTLTFHQNRTLHKAIVVSLVFSLFIFSFTRDGHKYVKFVHCEAL